MSNSIKPDMNPVIVTLVNTAKYKDRLQEIPHDSFLDLSIVYRMAVKRTGGEEQFILVTNEMMENVDIDTLREYAYANLLRIYGISRQYLKGGKYILTNERKLFGTSLILHPFILEGLSQRLQDDVYIIPLSVHECMAVSKRKADPEKLTEALKEANRGAEDKEAVLSDNIYFYDSAKKELSVYTE